MGVGDRKGKKRARADAERSSSNHATGKDPLEIAYGPTVGTHPQITADDFEVDTESGLHKPQNDTEEERHSPPPRDDENTGEESSEQRDRENIESGHSANPQYGLSGEDEFRNVWGR